MDDVKIAAFTGRLDDPASFFRMRQHFPALTSTGFMVKDFSHPCLAGCWHRGLLKVIPYLGAIRASRAYDVIWICRTLVRAGETIELLLKKPRIMDVDDSIWLKGPFAAMSIKHIAKRMDTIIAGNNFLAEWFSQYCKNVRVVPTAIDTLRYSVHEECRSKDLFVIGWTGTSSNFSYLASIEKTLARFLNDHKDARLKIIADRPWQSTMILENQIIFEQWSRNCEVKGLHEMSVGIMPLADSEWTRGKCSFKMLQYMAVGLPVIVSPVGMNNEVLKKDNIGLAASSENEWYEAFEAFYKNGELQHQLGQTGRSVVEKYYSADKVAHELAQIIRQAAGKSILQG